MTKPLEAVIDQRNGDFYVQSWDYSTGRYAMLSQGIWFTKVAAELPESDLGAAARQALARSRSEVPNTPERQAEKRKSRLALLKLAGVRGETLYQTGLSKISITEHRERDDFEVRIYDNPDPRQNMTERPERVYISKSCSDEELGLRIRGLLMPHK
jgi:hypothetical protein